MVEEPNAARTESRPTATDEPDTLWNALTGAIVTVVTAPLLPLSAVAGGAVAGYLQRGDVSEGIRVGALSGAIAAIPAFLVVWLVVGVFLLGVDLVFALSTLFAVVIFVIIVGYLLGAGALGGALGAYLRAEL